MAKPIPVTVTVTIPAGQSLSNSADLSVGSVSYIMMPPDWTPANMSFQVSNDNINFADLYDVWGVELLRAMGAGRACMVDTSYTQAALYVKLRSGPSVNPVKQAADRTITLVLV